MATYEIQTEKGTYQIETEDGKNSSATAEKQKGPGSMDTVGEQVKKSLGPIGMAGQAEDVIQKGFGKMGEKVATNLAERGIQMSPGTGIKPLPVSPEMAAAAGTTIQMTPDIIQSILPGEEAAKAVTQFAKTPSKTKILAQTIDDMQNDLNTLSIQQSSFPRTFVERKNILLQAKHDAGKAIQAFEKKAGIGLEGTIEVPEGFIKTAKKVVNMNPKQLAENVDLVELQKWNKIADSMLPSANKYDKVLLSKVKTVTTEAQDMLAPGIKQLRDEFGQASEAIKKLPDEFKTGKATLQEAMKRKKIALSETKQKLQHLVAKSTAVKKFLKKAGAGAATGLGLGLGGSAGYKLLK